jgi:hypothetical protein
MAWIKLSEELYLSDQSPYSLEKIDGIWYVVDNSTQKKSIPFADIFNNPVFPIDYSNTDMLVKSLTSPGTIEGKHFRGESANTPATPAFSFQGDINSGIYRIDSDRIGFSAGGSRQGEFGVGYGGFTGNVIQSAFAQTSTQKLNATDNYVAVGLPCSITPRYINSKILILYFIGGFYVDGALSGGSVKLYKNNSEIIGTFENIHAYNGGSSTGAKYSGMFFDTPNTLSSVTYEPFFVRRSPTGSIYVQYNSSFSNMILLEIQQ